MITQIYSPIQIPILEEKLNRDIHYKISTFLGFNHHVWIYLNLTSKNKISNNTKKTILEIECINYNSNNIDYIFEKTIIDNLHNIVQIHKVLPLLYRKCKIYNNLNNEFEWLQIIFKDGYETTKTKIWDDYDEFNELIGTVEKITQKSYRLNEKPIVNDITHFQFILSLISNNIETNITIHDNKPDISCKLKYKQPSESKIKHHCSKIKSKCKKESIYHYY